MRRLLLLAVVSARGIATARDWVVNGASPGASDKGPATPAAPFATISAAAAAAQAGDRVLVHGSAAHVYRERVAPATGNVVYTAAPGSPAPVVRGSEPLPPTAWSQQPQHQPGVWVATVNDLQPVRT